MNGQMQKYREYLKSMPEPIMPSQLEAIEMDLQGLMIYAERQGKKVIDLSDTEKNMFIKK